VLEQQPPDEVVSRGLAQRLQEPLPRRGEIAALYRDCRDGSLADRAGHLLVDVDARRQFVCIRIVAINDTSVAQQRPLLDGGLAGAHVEVTARRSSPCSRWVSTWNGTAGRVPLHLVVVLYSPDQD
jgi:hypothetical protein